jgi:hypothetical protein
MIRKREIMPRPRGNRVEFYLNDDADYDALKKMAEAAGYRGIGAWVRFLAKMAAAEAGVDIEIPKWGGNRHKPKS